jgi:hypothetical protein
MQYIRIRTYYVRVYLVRVRIAYRTRTRIRDARGRIRFKIEGLLEGSLPGPIATLRSAFERGRLTMHTLRTGRELGVN